MRVDWFADALVQEATGKTRADIEREIAEANHLNATLARLKQEVSDLNRDVKALTDTKNDLQGTVAILTRNKATLEETIKVKQLESKAVNEELLRAKERRDTLSVQHKELEIVVESQTRIRDNLKNDIDILFAQHKLISAQVVGFEAKMKVLNAKEADVKADTEHYESILKKLAPAPVKVIPKDASQSTASAIRKIQEALTKQGIKFDVLSALK